MARERYFLFVHGTQRGPYTVNQIHHMVNNSIVSPEALFWCEGLEQWQPVTQLIVPKQEKMRRRFQWSWRVAGAVLVFCVLVWLGGPVIRQGWKEQHQVDFTPESAYWRARGVVREALGKFTLVQFEPFEAKDVTLSGSEAVVHLAARTKRLGGDLRQTRWRVLVRYDSRLKHWQPVPDADWAEKNPVPAGGAPVP
jgi:hypothetical protein